MLLLIAIEEKMKRLWHSPATIPAFAPETLLENLAWVFGNEDILEYVKVSCFLQFSFIVSSSQVHGFAL